MFPRHLTAALRAALADTPAVMLVGARQTGKTTLARQLVGLGDASRYATLDDPSALDAAISDPAGFVAGLGDRVVIDEIQKAPGLLPVIKTTVDRDRRPGRFLLTGSADVLALPRVSESLAGRMEVQTLWPLSQGELRGRRESFVDSVFRGDVPRGSGEDPIPALVQGGYPEAAARERPDRRRAFFDAYVGTLVTRDVQDLAAIEAPGALRRLLQLAAARTAGLVNHAELSRSLGLPASTLRRYLAVLETLFLVHALPAWSTNRGKRLVRASKLHVVDTGLALALQRVDADLVRADRTLLGAALESFAAAELAKQLGWSDTRPVLHHFRSHAGQEVDLVLEDGRGRVVGVEVKAAATVTAGDFAGLRALEELAGRSFVHGVVLHLGEAKVPFGERLTAAPLDALWR